MNRTKLFRRSIKFCIDGIFVILFLLHNSPVKADEQNYQNYVVGEDAAGMGGAYTAFSDSPEGTIYNPGGIVFAKKNRLSLSANVVRYTTGTLKNAVAVGAIRRDLKLNALQVIPASSVSLNTFNFKRDEKKSPEIKKNAFALSFYYPDLVRYSGKIEVTEGTTDSLVTYRIDDSMLLAGPTYARRIADNVGLGASLFFAYRKYIGENFGMFNDTTTFKQNYINDEFTYGGLLAVIGAKWEFAPNWHTGLSIRPYSLRLYGSGDIYASNATDGAASATNPTKGVYRNLKVDRPLPTKITGGIGYREEEHFSVSGDVSLYLPNTFVEVHDPQGVVTDIVVKQNLTINGNLGGEYWLGRNWPLRGGVFTNFSSAPALGSYGSNGSKIDYYGGSLAIAYVQPNYTTQLGTQVSYGTGKILTSSGTNNFDLLHITAMVSGSFKF